MKIVFKTKFGTGLFISHADFFKTGMFSVCIMINGRVLTLFRSLHTGELKLTSWDNIWRKTGISLRHQ